MRPTRPDRRPTAQALKQWQTKLRIMMMMTTTTRTHQQRMRRQRPRKTTVVTTSRMMASKTLRSRRRRTTARCWSGRASDTPTSRRLRQRCLPSLRRSAQTLRPPSRRRSLTNAKSCRRKRTRYRSRPHRTSRRLMSSRPRLTHWQPWWTTAMRTPAPMPPRRSSQPSTARALRRELRVVVYCACSQVVNYFQLKGLVAHRAACPECVQ
mmetsp:Transcript_3372/g.8332  ORF Transcript_3372/g.8332 Transcript_3372/m.8332 type:complete len:209 (-) Transcript_3372:1248-1874(-)